MTISGKKIRYGEGEWFAVPLECGGFALGLVARGGFKAHGGLGYFFGPRYGSVPTESDTLDKTPGDAILVSRFGDLGIIDGEWPLIQSRRKWEPEQWPMPAFGRVDEVSGAGWISEYDESGELKLVRERRTTAEEARKHPRDVTRGWKSVEIVLSRLLCAK